MDAFFPVIDILLYKSVHEIILLREQYLKCQLTLNTISGVVNEEHCTVRREVIVDLMAKFNGTIVTGIAVIMVPLNLAITSTIAVGLNLSSSDKK